MLSEENFVVNPLPKIIFSRGASQELSSHIKSFGKNAVLVVTDKNLAASGVLQPILDASKPLICASMCSTASSPIQQT